MTEEEFRVSIGAYLLGALEPGEALEVQAHLRDCSPCQKEYLELTEVLPALAALPSDLDTLEPFTDADELVLRRAMRQIDAEQRRARRRPRVLAVAAAAAVFVIGVPVGLAALSAGSPGSPSASGAHESTQALPPPRTVEGSNGATRVHLSATLVDTGIGTRITGVMDGGKAGRSCHLLVTTWADQTYTVGDSVAVTRTGRAQMVGTVPIRMTEIARIEVEGGAGQVWVGALVSR